MRVNLIFRTRNRTLFVRNISKFHITKLKGWIGISVCCVIFKNTMWHNSLWRNHLNLWQLGLSFIDFTFVTLFKSALFPEESESDTFFCKRGNTCIVETLFSQIIFVVQENFRTILENCKHDLDQWFSTLKPWRPSQD